MERNNADSTARRWLARIHYGKYEQASLNLSDNVKGLVHSSGTNINYKRYCETLAKLKTRLRRVRPHMEQPLLQHDHARCTQLRGQLQRFDTLDSPPGITRYIALIWRSRIFISFRN